jgi:hypothetical protein
VTETGVVEPAVDDPRSAFVYQEALRGLLQQQAAVQSLQARAATLIFAASFANWQQNGRIVRRLREALQLALILLLCEIVAWFVSIAEASGT